MIKTNKETIIACSVWIVICLTLSSLAGWVTGHNVHSWYAYLQKPSFNPPAWVFAPVWTVLYIMIGISGGLLWLRQKEMKAAYTLFLLQLFANFIWSFLFFAWHQIGLALLDIMLLIILIASIIITSLKQCKWAAYMLLPYLAWVMFAGVLNFYLWQLN